MSWPPRKNVIETKLEEVFARTNNAKRAELIYTKYKPPSYAKFGRELPAGGVYYDSTYAGGDSDGTIEKPFNTLEGKTFNVPGQVINFKRGSVFLLVTSRLAACTITAPNVQFRDYGDPTLPPPLITGLKEVTGFTLTAGEYVAPLTLSNGPSCMAVVMGDQYGSPIPGALLIGTPGSLAAGHAGWSSNNLYLKDNPGTRKVFASIAGVAIHVAASGFRMDGVHCGYTHNNGIALLPNPAGGSISDIVLRNTGCFYTGNCGISGGDVGKTVNYVTIIGHVDVGAYNNAISGQGDDGWWWVLEADCTGKQRLASQTFAGYNNDSVTAHGTGFGPWHVMGCVLKNAKENNIDIIGGNLGSGIEGDVHRGSVAMFNRCSNTYEINVFMWCQDARVFCNVVTDSGQDPIRIGDSALYDKMFGGEVAYNFIDRGSYRSDQAFASAVGFVWGGLYIHNNTMVISPAATRTPHGSVQVSGTSPKPTPNPGGNRIENNIYIMQRDGLGIQQASASTASLITAKVTYKGNVYIYPSTNATVPFTTGGTPKTFAEWQSQVERSARLFTDTASAKLYGDLYAPSVDSPLATSEVFSAPAYDVNARYAIGTPGASAVAELPPNAASSKVLQGLIDATAGAKTYPLPPAASMRGETVFAKKLDASANTVTIQASGAETIDGANTKVLSTQWQYAQLYSNGTSWFVIAAN